MRHDGLQTILAVMMHAIGFPRLVTVILRPMASI